MAGMLERMQMEAMRAKRGGGSIEGNPFDRFFLEEYERLGRALYLVTNDLREAEDIAQEAMVRVLERWDTVAQVSSPVGYLYRTALNLHRSRLRRLRTRMRGGESLLGHGGDPLGAVEDRDTIGRMLSSLSRGQREALVLVEWVGMTADEAASILGIEAVSVRVRISRAKATLRATPSSDTKGGG